MRRSTVLSLPLQLVFLDLDYHAAAFHHKVFDRLDATLISGYWMYFKPCRTFLPLSRLVFTDMRGQNY